MKCPICGKEYDGALSCGHNLKDIFNEIERLKPKLEAQLIIRENMLNYIGQLQDELSVSEMSLTQCELRRKQEQDEIERLKKCMKSCHICKYFMEK